MSFSGHFDAAQQALRLKRADPLVYLDKPDIKPVKLSKKLK